jgi:hypothetical protein
MAAHLTPEHAAESVLDEFKKAVLAELVMLEVECVEGYFPSAGSGFGDSTGTGTCGGIGCTTGGGWTGAGAAAVRYSKTVPTATAKASMQGNKIATAIRTTTTVVILILFRHFRSPLAP